MPLVNLEARSRPPVSPRSWLERFAADALTVTVGAETMAAERRTRGNPVDGARAAARAAPVAVSVRVLVLRRSGPEGHRRYGTLLNPGNRRPG